MNNLIKTLLFVVALGTPAFAQPFNIGPGPGPVPCAYTNCSVTSLSVGGATIGSNALAVTGTANISGQTTFGAGIAVTNSASVGSSSNLLWNGRTAMTSPADGQFKVTNNAASTTLFDYGVSTASTFTVNGAIAASSQISTTGNVIAGGTAQIYWSARSTMASPSDGVITLANNAATNFTRLNFGGTTSSFPAIGRSSAALSLIAGDGTIPTYASCTALTTNSSGVIGCTASDKRLKTPQGQINNATEVLAKIPAAQLFTYRDAKRFDDKRHIGLYAQDVCNAAPLACAKRPYQGHDEYNYDDRAVIALLVKSNQELTTRIAKLEHRK